MASILQCLRKSCFTNDDDDDDHDGNQHNRFQQNFFMPGFVQIVREGDSSMYEPPSQLNFDRNSNGTYTLTPITRSADDTTLHGNEHSELANHDFPGMGDDPHNNQMHHEETELIVNNDDEYVEQQRQRHQGIHSLFDFIQSIGNQFANENSDTTRGSSSSRDNNATSNLDYTEHDNTIRNTWIVEEELEKNRLLSTEEEEACILVQPDYNKNNPNAAKDDTMNTNFAIPTIKKQSTIVLPGSTLQKKMSLVLKKQGYDSSQDLGQDECVICMEGFNESNPRMPTLCGCGENKTYFHLPCLYHWIEQSRECPTCRKELTWEEF